MYQHNFVPTHTFICDGPDCTQRRDYPITEHKGPEKPPDGWHITASVYHFCSNSCHVRFFNKKRTDQKPTDTMQEMREEMGKSFLEYMQACAVRSSQGTSATKELEDLVCRLYHYSHGLGPQIDTMLKRLAALEAGE